MMFIFISVYIFSCWNNARFLNFYIKFLFFVIYFYVVKKRHRIKYLYFLYKTETIFFFIVYIFDIFDLFNIRFKVILSVPPPRRFE